MKQLQSRWKLNNDTLQYYGLRNKENLFNNTLKLTKQELKIVKELPKELSNDEINKLSRVFKLGAIVEDKDVRKIPKSLDEARFCKSCAMNDYMVPGVEFNEEGLCPICQTKDTLSKLKGVNPIKNTFERSTKSRFDVAVFYTGGKDSTYLLYYLSKVLNLRVLALTWEIPYMSDSARSSIENAKRKLDNVEFITRYVSNNDLRVFYNNLYDLNENTCACPTLAYILFYPELVANKIEYFVVGNEPAQIAGLYYNHLAPMLAYDLPNKWGLNLLINIGRILTIHPPFRSGQFQTYVTMKQLIKPIRLQERSAYQNDLLTNIGKSLKKVPHLVDPLKRALKRSSFTGDIPRFVQVDFDEISGGEYNWRKIKDLIISECGWVEPVETDKGLHTSCKIEKCKEYAQFNRFYNMRSKMIPFSAIEMAIASNNKCLTKDEAIREIKNNLGFSLTEIPECMVMNEFIKR